MKPALRRNRGHGWLLLTLVLAAVAARAGMAVRQTTVCPDAVVYLESAARISSGETAERYGDLARNAYPHLLSLLRSTGLSSSLETSGRIWGVLIASLGVLPLFGWTRRRFNRSVATVAGILYVVHPELIEWAPELIRDPTFWTLSLSTLYLLQVAGDTSPAAGDTSAVPCPQAGSASVACLGWLGLAFVTAVLATAFRIEGLLFVVLVAAHGCRHGWRAVRGALHRSPVQPRPRFAGTLLASVLLVILVSGAVHRSVASSTGMTARTFPLQVARLWFGTWLNRGEVRVPSDDRIYREHRAASGTPERSPALRVGLVGQSVLSGLTPIYAVLLCVGVWHRRRRLRQWMVVGELALAAALLAGIWIHLWFAGQTSARYALVLLLCGMPWMAAGLLSSLHGIRRYAMRRARRSASSKSTDSLSPVPRGTQMWISLPIALVLVATIGIADAWSSSYASRESRRVLAEQLSDHLRNDRTATVLGSRDLERLLGYYGGFRFRVFAQPQRLASIAEEVRRHEPSFVVVSIATRHVSRSEIGQLLGGKYLEISPAQGTDGYPTVWIWQRRKLSEVN